MTCRLPPLLALKAVLVWQGIPGTEKIETFTRRKFGPFMADPHLLVQVYKRLFNCNDPLVHLL